MDNIKFWKGKKVLITGHTGFKGSWLAIWLNELGAKVIGYSLNPKTDKDNFLLANLEKKIIDIRGDIRDLNKLKEIFEKHKPEVVFHLAAQPLVRDSYEKPIETYEINVMGTMNILEAIKEQDYKISAVLITTDKCYENLDKLWGYREDDKLGGYDPYSSSKACCEILINSYRNSFFNIKDYEKHKKAIASVRAGNVIGGGDWSKDRLVPDIIKALENNEKIILRNPKSIRPWQHVLEPLGGYIALAEKIDLGDISFMEGWNFGPEINDLVDVEKVARKISNAYGKESLIELDENINPHEANLLLLDITKAKLKLGWKPVLSFDETISLTVDWYKNYRIEDGYNLAVKEIKQYEKYLEKRL